MSGFAFREVRDFQPTSTQFCTETNTPAHSRIIHIYIHTHTHTTSVDGSRMLISWLTDTHMPSTALPNKPTP